MLFSSALALAGTTYKDEDIEAWILLLASPGFGYIPLSKVAVTIIKLSL